MKVTPEQAVELLKKGEVVALPTETVYGLAALPEHFEKVYEIKQRPKEKRFAIAIAAIEMVDVFQPRIPTSFYILAKHYWPGPLTMVLPTKQGTTAFRMPDHPETLDVIRQTGPLILTSANLSGKPSATSFEEVKENFGEEMPALDGGPCKLAEASTIIEYDTEWQFIRDGALSFDIPK